jgi:hypothetical protein
MGPSHVVGHERPYEAFAVVGPAYNPERRSGSPIP